VFHLLQTRTIDPHTFDAPVPDAIINYALTTIFNGTGAVMLFFVISGFVLSCNVPTDGLLTTRFYAHFAVRRVLRIMPALWISVLFAAAFLMHFEHQTLSASDLLRAAVLQDQAVRINGPLWSLRVEMAISALFPLLLFANFRLGLGAQVVVLAGLSLLAYSGNDPTQWTNFLFCFQLGIMIPGAGKALIEGLPHRWAATFFALAVIGVMVPTNISRLGYLRPTEHSLIEGFAAFVVLSYVVFADRSRVSALLRSRLLRFFGMVSQSLPSS
jgi:peptidoglycan/LPS O-acetylase OafA/YrhL